MNKLRTPDVLIYDLAHLDGFVESAPQLIDGALADSHAHCGERFSLNDRAVTHRSFVLSRCDGLLTPHGLVTTVPFGLVQPFNTTWLDSPTALGSERIMVNCVKMLDKNRFKLVNGDAGATPDFVTQPSLWEDREQISDLLLGIQWRNLPHVKRGEPLVLRASVFLLGGHLDRENHIFHTVDFRQLSANDYGSGGGGTKVPILPAGPTPVVSRL